MILDFKSVHQYPFIKHLLCARKCFGIQRKIRASPAGNGLETPGRDVGPMVGAADSSKVTQEPERGMMSGGVGVEGAWGRRGGQAPPPLSPCEVFGESSRLWVSCLQLLMLEVHPPRAPCLWL